MKNDTVVKQKTMSGVLWKFSEKIGMQLMQIIIQIVLARLLMPEDYGIIGLLTIFIQISDVFILQGFTTALIQKKDADRLDYSSVFFANIIMSVLLYIILFLVAPGVALFYHDERLALFMRILSLNVVIGAFCAVHNAIMQKTLEFKKSFVRNISNVLTQGIVGIAAALFGCGAWSLVLSKLAGTFVGAIVICASVKWHPERMFSAKRIKNLFSYSSKLLGTNLLNTLFNNIHSIVIGRFFVKADLGFYQRGQQIPQSVMAAVDGSLNEVLYPAFSIMQDNKEKLKAALRRSIKTSMYIVLLLLCGLMAVAKSFTVLLLTEKWLPSVPFMRLSCLACMLWPLAARKHALNAIGRSDITFKLSLISKGITLVMVLICVHFGIYAILLGTILSSYIDVWITTYFVKKYIGYTYTEMLKDILPSILLASFTGCCVSLVSLIGLPDMLTLCIQVVLGAIIYIGGSVLFKIDSLKYVMNVVKSIIVKK